MANYKIGANKAIAVLVVAVLVASTIPTAIGAFASDRTDTNTQTVGNQTSVSVLESNVTNVETTGNNATIKLTKKDGTYSESNVIDESNTTTYTYSGENIDVTLDSVVDSNTVKVTYSYPNSFGWNSASAALYAIIPIFLILAILLFTIKYSDLV